MWTATKMNTNSDEGRDSDFSGGGEEEWNIDSDFIIMFFLVWG